MEDFLIIDQDNEALSMNGWDSDTEIRLSIEKVNSPSSYLYLDVDQVKQLHAFLGEQIEKLKE